MYEKSLKRSGRTERMIDKAIEEARKGKSVIIVADCGEYLGNIKARVLAKVAGQSLRIRYTTPLLWHGWRWEFLSGNGEGKDTVVLVDHYAIELYLSLALRALHRFDPVEIEPPEQAPLESNSVESVE